MRILMLGNSFTFANNMPKTLANLIDAEVVQHTRGGARLAEQLNPDTKMGGMTQAALENEKWDYVILQEMSNGPITSRESFLKNTALLCERIRSNGAVPVLYATWAYQKGGKQLESFGMDYDEMYQKMYDAYHEAADRNEALIADVGKRFYEEAAKQDIFAEDGCHPNELGSKLAAQVIADVILADQANKAEMVIEPKVEDNDTRLRILYLYQMLLTQTDEDHTLSTKQITDRMMEQHNILVHRTTVPKDIDLLRAAGFEIIGERKRAWEYYLADRKFSVPELKLLIDAVQSSKFITEKKSESLIKKLLSLTSENNADKLKRSVHITGRVKTENEKGYYIVDAINEAINAGVKISFYYSELNGKKKEVLRNDGKPYTVSPFDLIWDGDYYYLIGYCDEREAVRTYRVDRIKKQPEILKEKAVKKPKEYNVSKYTTEIFRMFSTDEAIDVTLLCDNCIMKSVVDKFGMKIKTQSVGEEKFRIKVKVCVSPTFYRWVFGAAGEIMIEGPSNVRKAYKEMLQKSLDSMN